MFRAGRPERRLTIHLPSFVRSRPTLPAASQHERAQEPRSSRPALPQWEPVSHTPCGSGSLRSCRHRPRDPRVVSPSFGRGHWRAFRRRRQERALSSPSSGCTTSVASASQSAGTSRYGQHFFAIAFGVTARRVLFASEDARTAPLEQPLRLLRVRDLPVEGERADSGSRCPDSGTRFASAAPTSCSTSSFLGVASRRSRSPIRRATSSISSTPHSVMTRVALTTATATTD